MVGGAGARLPDRHLGPGDQHESTPDQAPWQTPDEVGCTPDPGYLSSDSVPWLFLPPRPFS